MKATVLVLFLVLMAGIQARANPKKRVSWYSIEPEDILPATNITVVQEQTGLLTVNWQNDNPWLPAAWDVELWPKSLGEKPYARKVKENGGLRVSAPNDALSMTVNALTPPFYVRVVFDCNGMIESDEWHDYRGPHSESVLIKADDLEAGDIDPRQYNYNWEKERGVHAIDWFVGDVENPQEGNDFEVVKAFDMMQADDLLPPYFLQVGQLSDKCMCFAWMNVNPSLRPRRYTLEFRLKGAEKTPLENRAHIQPTDLGFCINTKGMEAGEYKWRVIADMNVKDIKSDWSSVDIYPGMSTSPSYLRVPSTMPPKVTTTPQRDNYSYVRNYEMGVGCANPYKPAEQNSLEFGVVNVHEIPEDGEIPTGSFEMKGRVGGDPDKTGETTFESRKNNQRNDGGWHDWSTPSRPRIDSTLDVHTDGATEVSRGSSDNQRKPRIDISFGL